MSVEFPHMRSNIVDAIEALSNRERQAKWTTRGEEDCLDIAIHTLYDDSPGLATNPEETVGEFLENEDEAAAVRQLIAALDLLFQRHGTDKDDRAYMEAPEWDEVVEAAKLAISVIHGATQ